MMVMLLFLAAAPALAGPDPVACSEELQGDCTDEGGSELDIPTSAPRWIGAFLKLPEFVQIRKYPKLSMSKRLDLAIYAKFFTLPPTTRWRRPILNEQVGVVAELVKRFRAETDERVVVSLVTLAADYARRRPGRRVEGGLAEAANVAVSRIQDEPRRFEAQHQLSRMLGTTIPQ